MKRFLLYIYCGLLSVIIISSLGSDCLFAQTSPKNDSLVNSLPTLDTITKKTASPNSQSSLVNSGPKSIVQLEFVKERVDHSPDSTFFNILKITNNNGHAIEGIVRISVPNRWKLISPEEIIVNISPGNTEYIPVRVSLARSVLGGVSYLISATLTSNRSLFPNKNQLSISKTCYISIPQKRNWDVFPVQRSVYFNRYSQTSDLKLKMINKGNGTELVKLEFEIGSSLDMYSALGNRHFTSIELRPHCDTVVSFPMRYLPIAESDLWNRDFRKLTVRITATVDTINKKSSVNFKYLESMYQNLLPEKLTPLTIEMQLQNLVSESSPRMLLAAYGIIMLKNDDVIDYNLRFMNIPFTGYTTGKETANYFWRRSQMYAGYKSDRWEVKIGDNVGSYGSGFLGSVGRGIGGMYRLNTTNTVGGALSAAVGTPIYSGNLFHSTIINQSIPLMYTLNAIVDNYNKINVIGASVQGSYSFLNGHIISLLLAPAIIQHNYNNQTFLDPNGNYIITNDPNQTKFGIAGQLGYQFHRKKLSSSLNVLVATRDYWQSYSGKLNFNGSAQYTINNKYSLVATSGVFLQDPRRYNRGILYPQSKYLSGMHRLELSNRITNKLTFFTGPVFEHFSYTALKINSAPPYDTTYSHFKSISPKLSIRCNYKNSRSGIINPYVLLGYTYITSAEDSSINLPTPFIPKRAFFNSRAGINIMQNNWGVNVMYYLGPQNISSASDYYYFGRYSKSLRIMPFFHKYYFNKTMLFSSYNTYSYEVLSNSERIALNARFQFFLGHDWTFFVDNNLYMSSNINSEGQKLYSRSYYLNIGVKKAFDIPQPRVKYYDLKVICFKDINGNQTKDENEQGLSDVVISIDRETQTDSVTQRTLLQPGQFAPTEMVTDNFGQIMYYHIPQGDFDLNIFPLFNLINLYNVNGQKQKVIISRDTTYYIPFVQSYKVVGKVILNRDEFSSLGTISTSNIRITATDSIGNSFPSLTTSDGSYIVYVPKAGEYKVTINKVFDDIFTMQESEYTVRFNGSKEFQVDFIFNEKKRSVNINGASTTIDTLLGRKATPFIIAGKDTLKNAVLVNDGDTSSALVNGNNKQKGIQIPVGTGITYHIQIATNLSKVKASQYPVRFKGLKNISEYSDDGIYKYTVGDFKTLAEAQKRKAELRANGFPDAFVIPFYKGNRVKY